MQKEFIFIVRSYRPFTLYVYIAFTRPFTSFGVFWNLNNFIIWSPSVLLTLCFQCTEALYSVNNFEATFRKTLLTSSFVSSVHYTTTPHFVLNNRINWNSQTNTDLYTRIRLPDFYKSCFITSQDTEFYDP